jgi:hypothetical protein
MHSEHTEPLRPIQRYSEEELASLEYFPPAENEFLDPEKRLIEKYIAMAREGKVDEITVAGSGDVKLIDRNTDKVVFMSTAKDWREFNKEYNANQLARRHRASQGR